MGNRHFTDKAIEDKLIECGSEEIFLTYLSEKANPLFKTEALEYLHRRKQAEIASVQHREALEANLEANRISAEANRIASSARTSAWVANFIALAALAASVVAIVVSLKGK
jgi:hypothetical protein